MSYGSFARYYDSLMDNVDYKLIVDYICGLFERYGKKPKLILDMACGTGSVTCELAKRGFEMIGADVSGDMLSVARNKAYENGADILFLKQDMAGLDLYGTVDAVVCTLDSLNHITNPERLLKVFKKVALFLEDDGVFIFDVNTLYKHREVLADNVFAYENEDVFCVWRNSLLEDGCTTQINLDFFECADNRGYVRYSESFCERAYTDSEIRELLKKAGMETLDCFGELTFEKPQDQCQRTVYAVRKVKNNG